MIRVAGVDVDSGLLALTIMALVAAVICVAIGARQRRAGRLTVLVGVLLLLPVALVVMLFLTAD